MNINSNYELSASDEISFNYDLSSNEGDDNNNDDDNVNDSDNNIAEFELHTSPSDVKKSRHSNKRNYLAKKKIEQLQEERQLRRFTQDYYDDWD
ncbi:hypothetical protein H4J42_06225 [Colwellia sp. BRX8-8]|nr:hypothetical protein [Colwellia sp. BRX8-8]